MRNLSVECAILVMQNDCMRRINVYIYIYSEASLVFRNSYSIFNAMVIREMTQYTILAIRINGSMVMQNDCMRRINVTASLNPPCIRNDIAECY